MHQGKDPSQLGHLEGLINQAPLALPLGPIHRKEALANQGLQDPLGVGVFWEGLGFLHQHLTHQVRPVDQHHLQAQDVGAANADPEIPLVEQAKPGAQTPAKALEQVGGEGLGLGPDRFPCAQLGVWAGRAGRAFLGWDGACWWTGGHGFSSWLRGSKPWLAGAWRR